MRKPNRIWIIGASGSGKTTLASELSKRLKIKNYDLDEIYWTKKWSVKRDELSRNKKLLKLVKKKKWIIEGTYSSWIEQGIKKADFVIWLDLHISKVAWRIILRHLKRKREKHPETWKDVFRITRASGKYKGGKESTFSRHSKLIKKHKLNFIVVKNKRDFNNLMVNLIR